MFFVADEGDVNGAKYLNILGGEIDNLQTVYLLDVVPVDNINQNIVCQKLDDTSRKFNIDRANVLLFLSDAASYMKSAAVTMKSLYPRMLHVTCFAHLIHNCAMKIGNQCIATDNVISTIKAVKSNQSEATISHLSVHLHNLF